MEEAQWQRLRGLVVKEAWLDAGEYPQRHSPAPTPWSLRALIPRWAAQGASGLSVSCDTLAQIRGEDLLLQLLVASQ